MKTMGTKVGFCSAHEDDGESVINNSDMSHLLGVTCIFERVWIMSGPLPVATVHGPQPRAGAHGQPSS